MRTAVAAPPLDPFGELFAFIDRLTLVELVVLLAKLRARYA